ncbi:hypothetical protein SAMN02745196_01378 [Clostridium collagenovorans DSM 3089]|uniref:Uncharacterized protein n=1 Tax=Clostridium collagenovorans DSM 3089 TaxID=1121306 RepID=A0A1M5VUP8_9CLOT|nr:hypothetical protein [Clostridium collagenovorans]SHH79019.1 hypothetical protein SAMN02745196_01378 [Clostridium collagenovorans DSM 3089]
MFKDVLFILIFSIIGFIVFTVLKEYVLDRVKINKWIVLVLALVVAFVPGYLGVDATSFLGKYIIPAIYVILFLWFIDLCGLFNWFEKKSNDKERLKHNKYVKQVDKKHDVIKPKAKKNRASK